MNPTIIEACAKVAHATVCDYRRSIGETPRPEWDELTDAQRVVIRRNVGWVLDGTAPDAETFHCVWADEKETAGYQYGEAKSAAGLTHPCVAPYDTLAPEQQRKAELFVEVVLAIADAPPAPPAKPKPKPKAKKARRK